MVSPNAGHEELLWHKVPQTVWLGLAWFLNFIMLKKKNNPNSSVYLFGKIHSKGHQSCDEGSLSLLANSLQLQYLAEVACCCSSFSLNCLEGEDFLFSNYTGNTEFYLKIGTVCNQCEPVSRKEFQNMPGPVPQYLLQWEWMSLCIWVKYTDDM